MLALSVARSLSLSRFQSHNKTANTIFEMMNWLWASLLTMNYQLNAIFFCTSRRLVSFRFISSLWSLVRAHAHILHLYTRMRVLMEKWFSIGTHHDHSLSYENETHFRTQVIIINIMLCSTYILSQGEYLFSHFDAKYDWQQIYCRVW